MQKTQDLLWREYNAENDWLYSLITDKTGAHYFQDKTPEEQMREFRETLARTADFLDYCGNPQTTFNSVHIAGTSGKGSVVSLIASILESCGVRTAHHVSPFLQLCNEKLIVDGRMISLSEFIELAREFRQRYGQWQAADRAFEWLKYGEAWTALTYLWFAKIKPDWVVMETGVGGRYDPSNVLPSKLAVITNVDFDHIKPLGPTLKDIAWHKAGIIKPGRPAITASTNPEVLEVLLEEASAQNAPFYQIKRDFDFSGTVVDASGVKLTVDTPYHTYRDLSVGLRGSFQSVNTALAVSAVDLLAHEYGIPLTEDAIRRGVQAVRLYGRMEIIQDAPLVILDGAHNPHKIRSLVDSLKAIYPGRRVTGVVGMLMTKDAEGMLDVLLPAMDRLIVTKPDVLGKPSVSPDVLAQAIWKIDPAKDVKIVGDLYPAIELALRTTSPDGLIVITGSLYLIGAARSYWVPPEKLVNE